MYSLKLLVPYICKTKNTNKMGKQQKDVVFVRHDALTEEVQVEQKPCTSKKKKESSLNKTIPCEQQAEQWF